jgi:hypothetical protein
MESAVQENEIQSKNSSLCGKFWQYHSIHRPFGRRFFYKIPSGIQRHHCKTPLLSTGFPSLRIPLYTFGFGWQRRDEVELIELPCHP